MFNLFICLNTIPLFIRCFDKLVLSQKVSQQCIDILTAKVMHHKITGFYDLMVMNVHKLFRIVM